MYIRFYSGEIDAESRVSAGFFSAVYELLCAEALPDYEYDALKELEIWFKDHLDSPFDHLPYSECYDRAICWFKPTAHEYLARAWEMVAILERNDILIWTIKAPRVGYIHYEDEVQVFAHPCKKTRLLLRGGRK